MTIAASALGPLMKQALPMIIIVVVMIGALKILAAFVPARRRSSRGRTSTGAPDPTQYKSKSTLMSPAERSFYSVLLQVVDGNHRIFSKVRLADILEPLAPAFTSAFQSALNSIQSKHVDFVMCDSADLSIQCVIELDDSSHKRADRQTRDAFVTQALEASGIPIFHVPAQSKYNLADLRSTLFGEAPKQS